MTKKTKYPIVADALRIRRRMNAVKTSAARKRLWTLLSMKLSAMTADAYRDFLARTDAEEK